MSASKPVNPWAIVVTILAVVIVAGGIFIACRYQPPQPLEISLEAAPETAGEIYIGGEVSNPGIYPLKAGDTVAELLRAAGGVTGAADETRLELTVLADGEPPPQRIDINRAEAWLLQALPGIGETKAAAIVEYRESHGPFRSVDELAKVDGIGAATVDSIRNMITVAD